MSIIRIIGIVLLVVGVVVLVFGAYNLISYNSSYRRKNRQQSRGLFWQPDQGSTEFNY
jgi:multisubunit Na+/H+ antiporter MnhG subunit